MYLSKADIENSERIKRLNIINSVSGIKPGNLVGTRSNSGLTNLAIISSVVHLGSSPAYLGFIMRPSEDVRRHTLENILENGFFTINHIGSDFIEKAHYTSAKFDHNISEFDTCQLTEEYIGGFHAPFVKESPVKIGLHHVESIPIKSSGTTMIVGQIEHLVVPDNAMSKEGYINLETSQAVGISGLNSYYKLVKVTDLPYARVNQKPDFKQ